MQCLENGINQASPGKIKAGYKKLLPVWLHGLFSPCRTVINFFIFEYSQRQKYIYIAIYKF